MMIVHSEQVTAGTSNTDDDDSAIDPLKRQAAAVFAADLAADRVPSIRTIHAALHVGQPRAQQLRGYLAAVA